METADLIDVKLDSLGQPAADTAGDFLQTAGTWECILQEIALEAQTQEGDLWYDEAFGWSLLDFAHAEQGELTELQIMQRIREKLSWYDEVNKKSIRIQLEWGNDVAMITILFRFVGGNQDEQLALSLDRINGEIVIESGERG